jgi:DNA-binding NtrC family response regulator
MKGRILVVDDDATIRETFYDHLSAAGYDVATADAAEQALSRVAELDPAVIITDVRMSGMSGIELARTVHATRPDIRVLVMTAHEDMDTAIGAMKAGAYDFLVKPLDLDHVDLVIARCFRERALERRVGHLGAEAAAPYALGQLVGRHARMIEIYKLIGTVAPTPASVLIRGETGTGKEMIARALHFNSANADEPFVAVNCSALAETLLESELFGHVRGAFTGATSDRRGRFELAGAGTIFLDEVGDVSPSFQSKLLRVLQEREFEPLGSERTRRTEARVIAATHRPIEEMVRAGTFREDLYFRLRVVEVRVPPLRERRSDIPILARHLLDRIAHELHREALHLDEPAANALLAYEWPGNVRELENALMRAAVSARGRAIDVEHLGIQFGVSPSSREHARPEAADADAGVPRSMGEVERSHVEQVLRYTGNNKRQAARILRISRPRLERLLALHGIVASDPDTGVREL